MPSCISLTACGLTSAPKIWKRPCKAFAPGSGDLALYRHLCCRPLASSHSNDTFVVIMNRRSFLAATLAGGAYSLSPMNAADTKTSILELRLFKMRNTQDSMMQRTSEFLGKSYIPALQRAGTGPVGAFASVIGQDSPFLLMLSSYPSMAALEGILDKIKADKDYAKDRDAFHSGALPYI